MMATAASLSGHDPAEDRAIAPARQSSAQIRALYLEFRDLLLFIACRKFRVPDDEGEALLHDVFLSLLTCSGAVRDPRAWLVAAMSNASRHWWRCRVETSLAEELEMIDPHAPTPEALIRAFIVQQALARLAPNDREILRRHYYEGQTAAEIARHFGTTLGYATKMISKALRRFLREVEGRR